MKRKLSTKLISFLLVLVLALTTPAAVIAQAADNSNGKYVKDVFIAYGYSEEEAIKWLKENDWEPVKDGNLNSGKTSDASGFKEAVAYMGIKRTNDPKEAITDMATMHMLGDGYSFDDYEGLVAQKKKDIDEFIYTFKPALEEYRANFNGEGSEGGQKRAQYAHDLLNKFIDGDPEDEYARNDTGKPLGDLLLNPTKTELGDDAYNALSAEEKANTADLQQIILESTGPAAMTVEQTLALATDTRYDAWTDRLADLSGANLVDNIEEYVPAAAGQNLSYSSALNYLNETFGDAAVILADQWKDIHDEIVWFESYLEANGLEMGDDEADEDHAARLTAYFEDLQKTDEDRYDKDFDRFANVNLYYFLLDDIEYAGDWGDTLYDLFAPEDAAADYSKNYDYFTGMAAALSPGQRAALDFLPLISLLKLGLDNDSTMEAEFPSLKDCFPEEYADTVSVYSGINRAIFRKGVALTSEAMMLKATGKDPYESLWEEGGILDIVAYTTFGLGAITLATGIALAIKGSRMVTEAFSTMATQVAREFEQTHYIYSMGDAAISGAAVGWEEFGSVVYSDNKLAYYSWRIDKYDQAAITGSRMSTAGRWMMGIGGAMMLAAAALKVAQIIEFYNRTFTQIPTMIVDEADIVEYKTGKDGKQEKVITFRDYAYYEVVKCNRQEIGIHQNAQDDVEKYAEWGCGDAADLNADVGKEWLAMYVNRSSAKGNPILADSLKVQYKSSAMPNGYTGTLHMFLMSAPVKLDETLYCYRDDHEGMYLFWKSDEKAYTASAFNYGYLALAAIGGLAVGIVGTTVALYPKRKKNKTNATA